MLFNSYIFIFLFFPLCFLGYYGLNHLKQYKLAMIFMTGMSLWFCGYQNIYYLWILLVSISINYLLYYLLKQTEKKTEASLSKLRKVYLWIGILLNVGILFVFKYFDFFIENLNTVLRTNFSFLNLLLPLGISFYTFAQISFLVDAYRQECGNYSFLEYVAYASFFPKLIQGPIAYHSEIIPQFQDRKNKHLNYENLSRGLYAFALGLGKKVLLADNLAKIVNTGYGDIAGLNTTSAILVMLSYTLQIYFDFSGYCDMAYGLGWMFNIQLPINFDSPYKAVSISDFWDRWHMTLTRFFTKYIYIPLGGSRQGTFRTYANVMIVFLVSGLWHGANWTFVLWGAFHGLMLVIEKFLKVEKWKAFKGLRCGVTFLLTTFAWSLFRAPSLSDAGLLWQRLLAGGFGPVSQPIVEIFQDLVEVSALYRAGFGTLMTQLPWLLPFAFVLVLIAACLIMKNTQEKVAKLQFSNGKMLVVVVLMFWSILSLSEISEYIYFNF